MINLRIQEINALKELVSVKENLSEHLALLYANEQQLRIHEQQEFKKQQITDRLYLILQAGIVVALALIF